MVRTVSTPFSWPLTRFMSRFFAHRPFPSMIMATCAGKCSGIKDAHNVSADSELKDFRLFVFVYFVDLLDESVGYLLDFILGFERIILTDVTVFF